MAHSMHAFLYIFMIVMPIFRLMLLSAEGKPIPSFGLNLPALVAPDKEFSKNHKEIRNHWHCRFTPSACTPSPRCITTLSKRNNMIQRMLPNGKSKKAVKTAFYFHF